MRFKFSLTKLYLITSALFVLGSCSEELMLESNTSEKVKKEYMFNYTEIVNSSNWKSYSNFQQRMNACQIPDSMLHKLPTAQLVKLCAHHPLNSICFAYDNPMKGVNYFMKNFNGFAELQSRKDATNELLKFYRGIDFNNVSTVPYPFTITASDGEKYSSSNISFMELVMASNAFPELCDNTNNINELQWIAKEKLEQKLNKRTAYSSLTISKTLMIQSRVELKKKSLDPDKLAKIQDFYDCGGVKNSQEIAQTINIKQINTIVK